RCRAPGTHNRATRWPDKRQLGSLLSTLGIEVLYETSLPRRDTDTTTPQRTSPSGDNEHSCLASRPRTYRP
ncbi:unnamed protein product, partial [Ectocarpus sp. 13 AM-2016]